MEKIKILSYEDYQILKTKKLLIKKASEGNLDPGPEQWNFLSEHEVPEIARYLIDAYLRVMSTPVDQIDAEEKEEYKNGLIKYFNNLEENLSIEVLYERLYMPNESSFNIYHIICIIQNVWILDFQRIIHLLNSDYWQCKKNALGTILVDKLEYHQDDIRSFNQLRAEVINTFPIANKYPKKRMISKKVNLVWKCKCGFENDEKYNNCQKCTLDQYGFTMTDYKVDDILESLNFKLEILEEYFK